VYTPSELHTIFMWQGRGVMHERPVIHIRALLCDTAKRPSAYEGKTNNIEALS
jgi:hypothetical protein